jgi:hypothetical protein
VIELPAGKLTDSFNAPLPEVNPVAPPEVTALHELVVIPVGNGSAMVAPFTLLGPALLATIVYVTLLPGVYVLDPSVLVTDRSALLDCVSVSVALLLPGVESVTLTGAVTVAVFTRLPVRLDGTAMVTV